MRTEAKYWSIFDKQNEKFLTNGRKKMSLYFKNREYLEKVFHEAEMRNKRRHTVEDAFFLLIKDIDAEDLSNLCELIKKEEKAELTIEEAYQLTQEKSIPDKVNLTEDVRKKIYKLAWECLDKDMPLGSKTISQGKINTSHWLGHCLWESKLTGQFASMMGLDVNQAIKYGILHDYGRKFTHDINHIIRGYEELSNLGWDNEAMGCITHSFLRGGRCSWNEAAEDGFFVDDNGIAHWKEGAERDDISVILDYYEYDDYDYILNIADLMATGTGIVSPAERIADIATRRTLDPINRGYFLAELTNTLIDMAKKMGCEVPEKLQPKVYAAKGVTLEEIPEKFEKASEYFYMEYLMRI